MIALESRMWRRNETQTATVWELMLSGHASLPTQVTTVGSATLNMGPALTTTAVNAGRRQYRDHLLSQCVRDPQRYRGSCPLEAETSSEGFLEKDLSGLKGRSRCDRRKVVIGA